jgi:hypothetical protein
VSETMRIEYCEAVGPDGLRCILSHGHPVDYHLDACYCVIDCAGNHQWGHGSHPTTPGA